MERVLEAAHDSLLHLLLFLSEILNRHILRNLINKMSCSI